MPEDFQTAEFVKDHGGIDLVVERKYLRSTISTLLSILLKKKKLKLYLQQMLQPSKKLYQKLQKQYSRRINLDLKELKKVLEKLNNPEEQINNVINVIGSDGKNSF